ncbi:hypothetical protein PPERSA_01620 [Pseudocohnilembus persalinus]|uniref:WW domain-containing protein n=1 Tax=Pseudocohnilembus persalinus TaxID=266149 RepID=A0A0V0QHU9_PSEPJ|nr:hypothetical protein PPERSA_01620 [Pseudocohnilembus persalinus]|eukprot:KRX01750.1 hypothetical protein PPERSA_01620 [Pseudocohnilembus persalinus]
MYISQKNGQYQNECKQNKRYGGKFQFPPWNTKFSELKIRQIKFDRNDRAPVQIDPNGKRYKLLKATEKKDLQRFLQLEEKDKVSLKHLKKVQKLIGMSDDDLQQFQDLIISGFSQIEGWKKCLYSNGNIYFLNTQTGQRLNFHPQTAEIIEEFFRKKLAYLKEQEPQRIVENLEFHHSITQIPQGVLMFLGDGSQLKGQSINQNEIQLQKQLNMLQAEEEELLQKLLNGQQKQKQQKIQSKLPLSQRIDLQNSNNNSQQQQKYVTNQSISINEKKRDYYLEKLLIGENLIFENKLVFNQGDEIYVEINLISQRIQVKNKQKSIIQEIDNCADLTLFCTLSNPQDSITIKEICDFPLHFSLIWNDRNVDLDLILVCKCGNKIYFNNQKCEICETYKGADNIYGHNAIEHFFLNKQPDIGSKWKYTVKYYKGKSQNVLYTVSVLDQNLNAINRFQGCLNQEGDTEEFEYIHTKFQKKTNQDIQEQLDANDKVYDENFQQNHQNQSDLQNMSLKDYNFIQEKNWEESFLEEQDLEKQIIIKQQKELNDLNQEFVKQLTQNQINSRLQSRQLVKNKGKIK